MNFTFFQASYKSKDKTFEAIRQLIGSEERPHHSRSRSRRHSISEDLSTTSSDSEMILSPKKTRSRIISTPHLLDEQNTPAKSRSGVCHQNLLEFLNSEMKFSLETAFKLYFSQGIAVANPRRYRSRSSDNDRWIEHTPGQPVKSGTVFQPVMKKKKSVAKLTDADDVVRRTKYCLNLQEPDGEGGVETKLYKVRNSLP